MTEHPHRLPQRPDGAAVDVLSDVLRGVRLTGAMLFLVEASAPWVTAAPRANAFAGVVLPAAQHLVSYHVVTDGRCFAGLQGEPPEPMESGDVLVVPQGDPYLLADAPDARGDAPDADLVAWFRRMAAGELPSVVRREGGGAERSTFICGFLGCDARPFNPVLAALPRVIHLRRAARGGAGLGPLVAFALGELRQRRAGGREVLLRLSELMFIEVVRAHVQAATGHAGDVPATSRGDWLAGLRDPVVARALQCLHAQPARDWTLDALAGDAGTSRSVLAERFAQLVGQPPMQYLAAWRMQLATRLLDEAAAKVATVAQAVGYASEAAFSRAFKKHAGVAPADWRRRPGPRT